MDYGFEQAKFEIIFANEINSDSANTWRLNRPGKSDVMHEGADEIVEILTHIAFSISRIRVGFVVSL